jgi:transglutaminase-like putative cysteine protease
METRRKRGSQTMADRQEYLASTHFVDATSPEVQDFVARAMADLPADASDRVRAVRLFEEVRDSLRYDPYTFSADPEEYRASRILQQPSAFCVPKAILLAAALRAAGIPAALGFADVRNHLNTPKLAEMMGTDIFIWHGYVQLWIGEESYKVTPAFNMELCDRFGVRPLVFDGFSDALFHEYDALDRRHMEYVNDRGLFIEFPVSAFLETFFKTYPRLVELNRAGNRGASSHHDSKFLG